MKKQTIARQSVRRSTQSGDPIHLSKAANRFLCAESKRRKQPPITVLESIVVEVLDPSLLLMATVSTLTAWLRRQNSAA
jgi:hypothetical protein